MNNKKGCAASESTNAQMIISTAYLSSFVGMLVYIISVI